ncbi:MAG: phosphoribosylanthranilate isomerase [Actinomycetota bacterium]
MSLFVKICGVTNPGTARAAVAAGADAVGFVFAESSRRISAPDALAISTELPPEVSSVAVFRRPSRAEVERVLEVFTPDLIQADHEAIAGFDGFETLPVFREGLGAVPDAGRFLYEGPVSGVGSTVDFRQAAEVARRGAMVLAGGLHPRNVGEAIDRVRPDGVDVSSGVESSPGVKDPALIESFVAAARAAEAAKKGW